MGQDEARDRDEVPGQGVVPDRDEARDRDAVPGQDAAPDAGEQDVVRELGAALEQDVTVQLWDRIFPEAPPINSGYPIPGWKPCVWQDQKPAGCDRPLPKTLAALAAGRRRPLALGTNIMLTQK